MKTYVTVCKNTILSNLKNGTNKPALRVSVGKYGKPKRMHEFAAIGSIKIKYDPKNPLPWGARAWLEVESGKDQSTPARSGRPIGG